MLSRNVYNKKWAPKLVFFNENKWEKLRKIPMIFDLENWLWKSNFGTFWHLPINPILKIQQFPLSMLILRQTLSNFVPPVWKLDNPYYHISHATFQYFITSLLTFKNSIHDYDGIFILRTSVTRLQKTWKRVMNYCYCLLTPFNFMRFLKMSQSSASASSWILNLLASQQKMGLILIQICYMSLGSAKKPDLLFIS